MAYVLAGASSRNAKHRVPSAESHCALLPPAKCTTGEYGFASLRDCQEACEKSAGNG
ncbi:hypothetical protein IscW_ISCW014845 [Ixodes scapularis]|uniref:Uncharacterized protein n=1 Tax=Ixodes scapularis TaxID=6945 RepID=B7QGM8_IXOSC|nr:hypothetical protein IscW_ISCW014845 [Ixodes scapularis]|eukprot:XP_002399922.1 hypothetical protein IscW_ISCW014845 [Ixodes scapularis]